jgi:TRAP-type mannitol/chloroaromatic compound transport system permease large subunit
MTESTRFRYQLITGLAVALLLLSAGASGAVTVILAATLFAIGLIVYPEMRRAGIIAGAIAAGVATAIAFALGQL